MSNLIENFRLDEHRREILNMRIASLGIKKSQYFRSLIDKDNLGIFRKPADDIYEEWKFIRSEILLSDTKKALLQALKKEFEDLHDNKGKKVKTVGGICKKYGFDKRVVISDLDDLIRFNIFTKSDKESKYVWTLEGIIIIPEYALALSKEKFLFSGDMTYFLNMILGEYNEVLGYFMKELGLTKEESNDAFKIVLGEHVRFITWLRDISFSFSGITDPDKNQYYCRQMMHFLFNYLLMNDENPQIHVEHGTERCGKLITLLANYFSKTA